MTDPIEEIRKRNEERRFLLRGGSEVHGPDGAVATFHNRETDFAVADIDYLLAEIDKLRGEVEKWEEWA